MIRRMVAFLVVLLAWGHTAVAQQSGTMTVPPNGATLAGSTQTFQWDPPAAHSICCRGAPAYQLWVGTSPRGTDIGYFPAGLTEATSLTVEGLPTDGRAVHVTLWTLYSGEYRATDYAYAAAGAGAGIVSPTHGSHLPGATQVFEWLAIPGASLYQLWIGSTPGAYDVGYYPPAGTTGTSVTVDNLPLDGRLLYVRLWTARDGTWASRDFIYAARSFGGSITFPATGSVLPHSHPVFVWFNDLQTVLNQLWIGTQPGGLDVGVYTATPVPGASASVTAHGVPRNGRPVYVRLWSLIDGTSYVYRDYAYTGAAAVPTGTMVSPAPGSQLAGASQVFSWTGEPEEYTLWVGSTPGSSDIAVSDLQPSSATVTNLPLDGRTLYVRLVVGAVSDGRYTDYVYTAAAAVPAASLVAPVGGAQLGGASQEFQWNTVAGARGYQLWLGSSAGMTDLGVYTVGETQTRVTATSLPTDGRLVHARLWTFFSSVYLSRDYVFTTGSGATPLEIWPVAGASFEGATQAFHWAPPPDAHGYQLWLGTTPGAHDLGFFPEGLGEVPQVTATGLPTDGRRIYARLWTAFADGYQHRDYTYFARSTNQPVLPAPAMGWQLPGPAHAFGYLQGPVMTIGDSPLTSEYGSGARGGLQTIFTNLPIDGRKLYARQTWLDGTDTRFRVYEMTAAQPGPAAVMLSPASDYCLFGVGTTFTFTFSNAGATSYRIWAGTTQGGQEYGEFPNAAGTTATSITVTVPPGQVPRRVRLWSQVGGTWHFRDYHYNHCFG